MGQVCTLYARCLCVKVLRVMKALLCQTLSVLGLNMEYEKFTYLVLCGILVADLRNVFCGIIGSCLLLILV